MRPIVATTIAELRRVVADLLRERGGDSLGLVPTMGALHAGHEALMRAARPRHTVVAASLFVNPLQFDNPLDLTKYPRNLEADLDVLERGEVDVVFAPSVEEMYPGWPDGPMVRVSSGRMGTVLEGHSRPGHFDGVVTVVAKLFNIFDTASAARLHAYFGQKDAQQLMIVKRMVADLDFPVTIVPVPTERTPEGLAMSSRNQLIADERYPSSFVFSEVLFELRRRAAAGLRGADLGLDELAERVRTTPHVTLDYFTVVDPGTLEPTDELPALALIAGYVGSIRLIDNMMLGADD